MPPSQLRTERPAGISNASRVHISSRTPRRQRCVVTRAESGSQATSSGRREFLLRSSSATFIAGMLIGTDDPTTILNSVLSGYGLPTLKASSGFRQYDEFEDDFTFEYPRSWVVRRNTLRQGIYLSDFQTADKATVEVFPVPEDGDVLHAAVTRAVVPGQSQADDKLNLPSDKTIKSETQVIDGQTYLYLAFPSETITRSGYNIRRKNFAVAAVRREGTAVVLAASARSDQFNKDKEQVLRHIVESFRVR